MKTLAKLTLIVVFSAYVGYLVLSLIIKIGLETAIVLYQQGSEFDFFLFTITAVCLLGIILYSVATVAINWVDLKI